VIQDPSKTREEKAGLLEEIEARLPERVREARRHAAAPARVSRQVEAMRAAGDGDAEIFAVRERELGAEAAQRLAALDGQNAAWQARMDAYRAERASILEDASLAGAERDARLEALRAQRFDPQEQVRVRALDQAAAGAP
jgi:lipase chaperone LimK